MKIVLFFGIYGCMFSFAQGQDTLKKIIPPDSWFHHNGTRIYIDGGGGKLEPIDFRTQELMLSSVWCNSDSSVYFLDGLEIPGKFIQGDDWFRGATKEEGTYSLQFKDSDTTKCVEFLKLSVSLNTPLVLNRVELDTTEARIALKAVKPEEIISIKRRKTWFLGSTYLEIVTK